MCMCVSTLSHSLFSLISRADQWGCAPSAVPPGECCLPVPGSNSQEMSGCHSAAEQRWDYNQFFSVKLVAHDSSAGAVFRLVGKGWGQKCAAVVAGKFMAQTCESNHDIDTTSAQTWQIVTVPAAVGTNNNAPTPAPYYLLQNVGSQQCVISLAAREAGKVGVGACNASADRSWLPVCDGLQTEVVPGWPCVPAPPTPPAPTPRPRCTCHKRPVHQEASEQQISNFSIFCVR